MCPGPGLRQPSHKHSESCVAAVRVVLMTAGDDDDDDDDDDVMYEG